MRFLPVSLTVLIVELKDLDETLALFASLEADPVDGIVDIVPAARTLMIRFKPEILTAGAIAAEISKRDLTAKIPPSDLLVEIPVTYDGEDLQDVAELTGLSVAEVIQRHTASEFTVAFCGFAPGFGYLVGGDPALQVPRRQSPRTKIPAGSVALAGAFSGV
ncbi:MAG: allophanate hydrolase subunit 1, partial [Pseudomonadota bacterium]|nr:allophanate hydrolase subunit 1 [Pseudomonadota bacterium]